MEKLFLQSPQLSFTVVAKHVQSVRGGTAAGVKIGVSCCREWPCSQHVVKVFKCDDAQSWPYLVLILQYGRAFRKARRTAFASSACMSKVHIGRIKPKPASGKCRGTSQPRVCANVDACMCTPPDLITFLPLLPALRCVVCTHLI